MKEKDVAWHIGSDGSITGRKLFRSGTIAMMRLQFSSNLGTAFTVCAERVPQVIVYDE